MLLEKEDEMDCAVSGCNFLLKAVQHEAFSYEDGQAVFTSGGGPRSCPSASHSSLQPSPALHLLEPQIGASRRAYYKEIAWALTACCMLIYDYGAIP